MMKSGPENFSGCRWSKQLGCRLIWNAGCEVGWYYVVVCSLQVGSALITGEDLIKSAAKDEKEGIERAQRAHFSTMKS